MRNKNASIYQKLGIEAKGLVFDLGSKNAPLFAFHFHFLHEQVWGRVKMLSGQVVKWLSGVTDGNCLSAPPLDTGNEKKPTAFRGAVVPIATLRADQANSARSSEQRTTMISATEQAPVRKWVKIPNILGLYRNARTGRYYGVKKIRGERKEQSHLTTDRKIAERRHREWISNLELINPELERTRLRELLDTFIDENQGCAIKTQKTNHSIIRKIVQTWPDGIDIEVRHIRPSHLKKWLALHERRLKNTTYNRYAGLLKQLFEIAVDERIIVRSPFDRVKKRWKRPQKPIRRVPTLDQFQRIVDEIRTQRYSRFAEPTADFVEFLGLAGLGQAEAASLTWGDVDWENEQINIRRQKTDEQFNVPIYPFLRPFLERLRKTAESLAHTAPVFHIHDAKKALKAACERLGYRNFTQRNIRQSLIRRLWQAGVDKKLIAEWQGHQDGGQLIIDTYTEVFGDDDADYKRQQLAKLVSFAPTRSAH